MTKYMRHAVSSLALMSHVALCSAVDLNRAIDFSIAAQKLDIALMEFSRQAKVQIIASTEVLQDLETDGATGNLTIADALKELLGDSGLSFTPVGDSAISIGKSRHTSVDDASADGSGHLSAAAMELRLAQSDEGRGVGSSSAQESDQDAKTKQAEIETIVVTAQKREEKLQDVPISITALTGAALQRTGADKFADYIGQVPGAFYSDAGQGRSRINMRGLQTAASIGFEEIQSPTAIYIDDLPSLATSNPWAQTDLRLYDIERIEVLRGPQGTLFGSGSLGGALRILTNKPNLQQFDASMEAALETVRGGDESWRLSSMVNVPLVRDKFALRLVGYYRNDGGWVNNTFRNEKNVNSNESKGGRIALGFNPTEDLSLRLTVTHQEDFSDDKNSVNFNQASVFSGWTPAYTDTKLTSYNLNAEYDFGPLVASASTTYADSHANLGQGLGMPFDYLFHWRTDPESTFSEDNIFTSRTFVQELRLTSHSGGRVQWVLGGFYMDQDMGQRALWSSSTVWPISYLFYPNGSTTLGSWDVPASSEQKALFGEASINLTDTVTAIAGARLFDYQFERQVVSASGILGAPSPLKSIDETGVTPKFAVRYKPNEKIMGYVQAAKGFRLGQPNAIGGLVDPGNGFVYPNGSQSDQLWNYELGIKSVLLSGALRLNTALFYIDWKDVQLLTANPLPNQAIFSAFNDNSGDATSKGGELEIEYAPTQRLSLGSSLSVVDAKLESVLPGTTYKPGDRLPGTPKFWASNYVQLSAPRLLSQADAYVLLSHRYVGKVINFLDNDALGAAESDSYHVLDARAGLTFNKYEVALYVNNLADEDAATAKFPSVNPWDAFTGGGFMYRLRPRTVGVTFRAGF